MRKRNFLIVTVLICSLLISCGKKEVKPHVDLNSLTLDEIVAKAKNTKLNTLAMPDTWANWGETWRDLKEIYGIIQTDADMSSAEELALFENEKDSPTKDMGDVGQSFGPIAEHKKLTTPYKTSYWDDIPDWAKDDDGDWIVAYYGTISMLINNNTVKVPPKSFADLLTGDYKVTVGDVNAATQAQIAVLSAAIAYGGAEDNIEPGIEFFREIAKQGRLDLGDTTLARLAKGEVDVMLLFDFNALNYKHKIESSNPNISFTVNIPSEVSIQSGYCTIINRYAPNPYAAALAREYILSDKGQINLAKGFARPIRNIDLPEDIKKNLIPDDQYVNARPIIAYDKWIYSVRNIGIMWQGEVLSEVK